MEATYAFRRVYINEESTPVREIVREYPCLSEKEEAKIFFNIIVITAGTCTQTITFTQSNNISTVSNQFSTSRK